MRKLFIAAALLFSFAPSVMAQAITNAQPVWSAVKYQTTCSSTTVGLTASELTSNSTNTAQSGGISQLKVTNVHLGATICCSSSASVTCGTGAATDGETIARAVSATVQPSALSWAISTTQKWYCISTLAATGATVCKTR